MKIGIVCPYNLGIPGGVQQHVTEQAAELRRRGHIVKVITPKPRGDFPLDDPKDVIFIGQSARIKAPQHTSVDVSITVGNEEIDNLFESEQFDLVHYHEPVVPMLSRQLLARTPVKTVATFHAAMPETILAKSIAGSIGPYMRGIAKYIDAVTVVSEAATGYIGKYVGVTNMSVIPNGVALEKFKHRLLVKKQKSILYVGRLEKRKGVKHLIDAFELFSKNHPGYKLIIAGDGPDRSKLEGQVEEAGLQRKVVFKGFVSEKAKQKLLQSTALFVSPALYGESFGIVLLEAMASETVLIAGNNPGYASVLKDVGSLSLIDPEDGNLFAKRMELFIFDEALRKHWLEWAKKEIKQYSYKSIVTEYEKVYKELVR